MWDDIDYRTVIYHSSFSFVGGGRSPKLLVVLGWHPECAVFALTTSVPPPPPEIGYGCHAPRNLYKIQKHPKDFFNVDTFVSIARLGDLRPEMANHSIWTDKAEIKGVISEQTANAIKNCALLSHDVSARRKKLLGLKRPP